VTNGANSPFSALYILVIATASLLVPTGGGVFIAALGIVLYFADVALLSGSPLSIEPGVWLQLSVIAVVTLVLLQRGWKLRH